MSLMSTYLWCALGIVISVLLPIIWQAVNRYFPRPAPAAAPAGMPAPVVAFWRVIMPYLLLGLASLLTAILLVAFLGDQLTSVKAALLAGYAWDSTLQKIR